jgi:hypothetical protein
MTCVKTEHDTARVESPSAKLADENRAVNTRLLTSIIDFRLPQNDLIL